MSHFYGILQGSRGEASRCGTKGSGMVTHCAGWGGCIMTESFERDDIDMYKVWLTPWKRSGGSSVLLSAGRLQADCGGKPDHITPWAKELFESWLPKVENMETLDWMQRQIAGAYMRIGT